MAPVRDGLAVMLLLAALTALAAAQGCSPLAVVVRDLDRSAEVANMTLGHLEAAYAAELATGEREAVRRRYAAAFAAHRAYVLAWEVARSTVRLASQLEAAGAADAMALGEAVRMARAAVDACAAFERLAAGLLAADGAGGAA